MLGNRLSLTREHFVTLKLLNQPQKLIKRLGGDRSRPMSYAFIREKLRDHSAKELLIASEEVCVADNCLKVEIRCQVAVVFEEIPA